MKFGAVTIQRKSPGSPERAWRWGYWSGHWLAVNGIVPFFSWDRLPALEREECRGNERKPVAAWNAFPQFWNGNMPLGYLQNSKLGKTMIPMAGPAYTRVPGPLDFLDLCFRSLGNCLPWQKIRIGTDVKAPF